MFNKFLIFYFSLQSFSIFSQTPTSTPFDLKGALKQAQAEGCTPSEMARYIERAKNIHCGLPAFSSTQANGFATKVSALSATNSVNADFEMAVGNPGPQSGGFVPGWSIFQGANSSFCSSVVTTNSSGTFTVFNAPTNDGNIIGSGSVIASYYNQLAPNQLGGNCFLRLNNSFSGAKVLQLTKSYLIDSSNYTLKYALKLVLANPNHSCCDQPGAKVFITITNTALATSTILSCPQGSFASGAGCGSSGIVFYNGNNGYQYTDWLPFDVDLKKYKGLMVTLDVYALDCALGGHAGYLYFDACINNSDPILYNNGVAIPFKDSTEVSLCGNSITTLSLNVNNNLVSWQVAPQYAPLLPTPYTIPSPTNNILPFQFLLVPLVANVTSTNGCSIYSKTITIVNASLSTSLTVNQATCNAGTGLVQINALNTGTVVAANWQPSSAISNGGVQSANVLAGTQGNVTITDNYGCVTNKTFTLLPTPLAPSITVANIVPTCSVTSVALTPTISPPMPNALTFYSFYPAGAIFSPSGVTVNPGVNSFNVSVSNTPGNYVFTITNPQTLCTASSMIIILPCLPTSVTKPRADELGFVVFPNPTKNNLTIKSEVFNEAFSVYVYNAQGQLLHTEWVNSAYHQFALALPKGFYTYALRTPTQTLKTDKLIID